MSIDSVSTNVTTCQVGTEAPPAGGQPPVTASAGADSKQKGTFKSKWVRVTRDNPCPICNKPDWCMVSPDGTKAICPRTPSDRSLGEAGYLHNVDGSPVSPGEPSPICGTQDLKLAVPDRMHLVYSMLLDELQLASGHLANLHNRGLPDDVIAFNGYKSLPDTDRSALVAKLKLTSKVGGVPGFFLNRACPDLAGPAGLLIPVRGVGQLIKGMQIRRDSYDGQGGKYVWLSSSGRQYGCGPGSPAHVALPQVLKTANFMGITEGPLKADIAAYYLGCVVVGIAGVNSWRKAVDVAATLLPRAVVLALDNDKMSNPVVRKAADDLEDALLFNHFNVYEGQWPAEFKGIDDYLAAGGNDLKLRTIKKASLAPQATPPPKKEGATSPAPKAPPSTPYKESLTKSANLTQKKPRRAPQKAVYGAEVPITSLLAKFGAGAYGKTTIAARWKELTEPWDKAGSEELGKLRNLMLEMHKKQEGAT